MPSILVQMDNSQTNPFDHTAEHGFSDLEVNRALVDRLYADGVLTESAYNAALSYISRQRHWWTWINRSLLFSGAALALAGIVYFFAYNWSRLSSIAKFSMIEIILLGCLIGAWKVGLDRIAGQVLLLAASMMVGVFLAVFGQIYQTGADSYELFVGWAALIFAWVLIGRFGALWIMWLALINVALMSYFSQIVYRNNNDLEQILLLDLALINGAALIVREFCHVKLKIKWLEQNWLRWVLLSSIFIYLLIPSEEFIVDYPRYARPVAPLYLLIMIIVGAAVTYRYLSPDLFALTQCALMFCIIALTFVGRVMLSTDAPFIILAFGFVVVITASVMAFVLRQIGIQIAKEAKKSQ
jgi:uncharacterized membrane protein